MANETDLLAAETALRDAAWMAGFSAYQLKTMWEDGLGVRGGAITPVIHDGVGNSVANSELLQTELLARADDCNAAARTAAAFASAMSQYRTDLEIWTVAEASDPDGDHGLKPTEPDNGYFGTWPSWVSE